MRPFHLQLIESELESRCRKNPRYSLRSFAGFLELDPSLLSKVLHQKRTMSSNSARTVMDKLALSKKQRERFEDSLLRQKMSIKSNAVPRLPSTAHKISQDQFRAIADWYHYGILQLVNTRDFVADERWIARSLGIGVLESRYAINRLVNLGLLRRQGNTLVRTKEKLTTTNRRQTSKGLKQYGKQIFQKASESQEKDAIEERSMFNMTMAIDPKKLDLARELMEEFANRMSETLEDGEQERVYHLNISLFPLQKVEKPKNPIHSGKD